MFYSSLLQDLLRTNSVEINLFLYAENKYVRPLKQLLASLGFFTFTEEQAKGQTNQIFDHTLLKAIKKFNQKNKISGDGARLKAYSLWRMLQCEEIIPFLKIIDTYTEDTSGWQKETHFLYDPLKKTLSFLDFKEDTLSQRMERFCIYHGLIYPVDALSSAIRQHIIQTISEYLGEHFNAPENKENTPSENEATPTLSIIETPDNKISINDGQIQLVLTKKAPGVYWMGNEEVGIFLQRYPAEVNPEISKICLQVIHQVARNEGKLDAINTYDQAFLSVGIFQWTLGTSTNAGELPALLKKVKVKYPVKYATWFTPLGIDIDEKTDETTGFITLQGERIASLDQKEMFRRPFWAFHFWKVLMQPEFQAIQIEHAHDRFKNFYFKPEPKGLPYPLYQIITSSYGVALLLDMHVNRPGWVYPCIGLALAENANYASPDHWGTEEEAQIIDSYLKIRATYTDGRYAAMTSANERANKIGLAKQDGLLSRERGSFEYLTNQWEGFGMKGNQKMITPPPGYKPEDYPDIEQ
jgi:hypothetical protein